MKTLAAFALAALVGYAGAALHVPLAWMLGPLLAAAALSLAGIELRPHEHLRRIGQLAIGAGAGLNMTAVVLVELGLWLPLMVFSALFSVVVACLVGCVLARLGGLDQKTAFFSCLPGGLGEMALIGSRIGAQPEPIAVIQTLRIALVVLTIPPILLIFGSPDYAARPDVPDIAIHWALAVIGGGACVAFVLRLVRLNNPYMIGGILFTAALTASGLVAGAMPPILFAAAQLLLGFAVGCQFRRSIIARLPRVSLLGIFAVLAMVLAMAGLSALVSLATGLPLPVLILATAPGGISEMAVTAQILHLAVPTVVAFQVVRGILVNGFATHYFAIFTRLGLFRALERLLRF